MNSDETKAWLKSYRYLIREAERIEEELEEWRSRSEKITRACSGMPSGSGTGDQVSGSVEKIIELEGLLEKQLERAIAERDKICKTLAALPNRDRQIMEYRYIHGMKWEQIAVKMNLEYRWLLRLHKRILQRVCKLTIESHT